MTKYAHVVLGRTRKCTLSVREAGMDGLPEMVEHHIGAPLQTNCVV